MSEEDLEKLKREIQELRTENQILKISLQLRNDNLVKLEAENAHLKKRIEPIEDVWTKWGRKIHVPDIYAAFKKCMELK